MNAARLDLFPDADTNLKARVDLKSAWSRFWVRYENVTVDVSRNWRFLDGRESRGTFLEHLEVHVSDGKDSRTEYTDCKAHNINLWIYYLL